MLFKPATFWNFIAKRYARSPVADQKAYEYKLDFTAKHLKPTDHVFEFGCGTGTTALIHAPRVAQIDAIDFSPKMIEIARGKAQAQGSENVRFEVSSIEDWGSFTPKQAYDVILAMSILHLVDDLDTTLAQVNRLLKPGGWFFSSTACLGQMNGAGKAALGAAGAIGVLPKVLFFSPDQLTDRIAANGFSVEHVWQPNPKAAVFVAAQKPA